MSGRPLWLELPPHSLTAPPRLLVLLHGAGSSPETFAPVAIAWQLKFPGALAALMQGFHASPTGQGHDWFDTTVHGPQRQAVISAAVDEAATRIRSLQRASGLDGARTILIGFSQGATLALELARRESDLASIVVGYAARLASPLRPEERIAADVHLIHGGFDSLVPAVHARQALRGLQAIGTRATLDITEEGAHSIDQDMVILGTTRAMQSVFRGRRRPIRHEASPTLH